MYLLYLNRLGSKFFECSSYIYASSLHSFYACAPPINGPGGTVFGLSVCLYMHACFLACQTGAFSDCLAVANLL